MKSTSLIVLFAVAACEGPEPAIRKAPLNGLFPVDPTETDGTTPVITTTTTTSPTTTTTTTNPTTTTTALWGFIGSPCLSDADCPYDGGTCLVAADGFPNGMCSSSCDAFCDDAAGYPTTFCADIGELPAQVDWLGDGGCVSRCDFGVYPFDGCRQGYGCVVTPRANDTGVETYTCLPDVASNLSTCMDDLAQRGVPFTPTIIADSSPGTHPNLTCHVEEPIVFASGYQGVDIAYHEDLTSGSVTGGCSMGQALADTIEDVSSDGVDTLRHLGTYVCRVISGTDTLSRHAYGDAIDIYGFDFTNGDRYTLVADWEHETTSFSTTAGAWLYDTAYDWNAQQLWNIILTPNYNSAHDNHFHVDLTPGSDFIGLTTGYFGPSPWDGE